MQDFFNKFFGGQGGGQGGDDDELAAGERAALGSGFIVDPAATSSPTITSSTRPTKIYVKLLDDPDDGNRMQGRPATVVGVDPKPTSPSSRSTPDPLPTIKLGNSEGAQVGDWVLAIGSPFGLSQTVSAGIVSAKNRAIDEPDASGLTKQFQNFIQTDAAINPGNSGGPLVDMAGNVVGMNTAIYTQSMGSQGVGFAMPSNVLAKVYNDLIGPSHKVVRGSIGIRFQAAVPSAVSRMYGFANGGVIVGTVEPGKGAAKSGLKPDDILVSINKRQIKDGDDLVADISGRPVGSTVEIGYLRDGKPHTASVLIGDRADLTAETPAGESDSENSKPSDAGQSTLGITVTPIPQTLATKMGVTGGVAVATVTPGSFADEIGLARTAVITEINRQPVTDEASYRAIVSKIKTGDDVVFVIRDPRNPKSGSNLIGGTLR